jgi:hypothetical protein
MPTADRNDLMPAQEKLEWVTPKISLMEAVDTEAKRYFRNSEWHPSPLKSWTFLIDFTSNPATPTKTSNCKGSA